MFNISKQIGISRRLMSKHLLSDEINEKKDKFIKMSFIGLGQGGGRIASEFARFGFPTYLFNSSSTDMAEHENIIPSDKRILTISSETNHSYEGTDKDANLGFTIASERENKLKYAKVMMSSDIQEADFVWITASLGGGTGNGALPVVTKILAKARQHKQLSGGKVSFGVIVSLPAKSEVGSKIRENALKGIQDIQSMISEGSIGSVIVIDNEKLNHYYEDLAIKKIADGDYIDAKSYSNIMVSLAVIETAALPLLKGRVVLDMTEYLGTISTPGWLSISKISVKDNAALEPLIKDLFEKNDILAETTGDGVINAAAAILLPESKSFPTDVQDKALDYAGEHYKARNKAIVKVSKLDEMTLYGMSVSIAPPVRVQTLQDEYNNWKENERLEAEKMKSFDLKFNGVSGFTKLTDLGRNDAPVSLEDLLGLEDDVELVTSPPTDKKNTLSEEDLIDLD